MQTQPLSSFFKHMNMQKAVEVENLNRFLDKKTKGA